LNDDEKALLQALRKAVKEVMSVLDTMPVKA